MEKAAAIIRKKPLLYVFSTGGFLLVTALLKWKSAPGIGTALFLAGGLAGIYALDLAEEFFSLHPSPLRSILFLAPFPLVAFFVITSSGSLFASGLVLVIFLTLLLRQAGELRINKSLDSWYRTVAVPPPLRVQRLVFLAQLVLMAVFTFLFIRT